jgi:hypothetical protein
MQITRDDVPRVRLMIESPQDGDRPDSVRLSATLYDTPLFVQKLVAGEVSSFSDWAKERGHAFTTGVVEWRFHHTVRSYLQQRAGVAIAA